MEVHISAINLLLDGERLRRDQASQAKAVLLPLSKCCALLVSVKKVCRRFLISRRIIDDFHAMPVGVELDGLALLHAPLDLPKLQEESDRSGQFFTNIRARGAAALGQWSESDEAMPKHRDRVTFWKMTRLSYVPKVPCWFFA